MLSFALNETKRLLPTAISEGGNFYQEHLRGTPISSMTPAILGRGIYHLTTKVNSGADTYTKFIAGLGLALVASSYKGLREWTWPKDWASLAILPMAKGTIDYLTPNAEEKVIDTNGRSAKNKNFSPNQERARWMLQTAALMAQTCAFYALQRERNGSLPLKPYLYFGATVTLLKELEKRYVDRDIDTLIDERITDQHQRLALKIFHRVNFCNVILMATAWFVKRATGQEIQVSRKWEALTFIGANLAGYYLRPV